VKGKKTPFALFLYCL